MELTANQKKVRLYLINLASENMFISYQILSDECGLNLNMKLDRDRTKMGVLLDAISIYEHKHSRPLLSGIVVNYNATYGPGFYSLYDLLRDKSWIKSRRNIYFTKNIIKQCVAFWQNEQNKKQFENYI